jgi:hypothetical protein
MGRFNRILVAEGFKHPENESFKKAISDASYYSEGNIAWANLTVKHDGGVYRHEKILFLKKYLNQKKITLRVCGQVENLLETHLLNCGRCEKCLRTIATLLLAGIDPNECGFKLNESILKLVKTLFRQKKTSLKIILKFWKPIQQIIPDEIETDKCGSKEFFTWLKNVDLNSVGKPLNEPISILYHKTPFPISNTLRKIFYDRIAH